MTPRLRLSAPTLEAAQDLQAELRAFRTQLVEDAGSWSLAIDHDREFNLLLLDVIERTSQAMRRRDLGRVVLHVDDREYGLPRSRAS